MNSELKEVVGHKLLKEYIYLPSILHSKYEAFVPPVYKDEFDFHNPEKNRQIRDSEIVRLLAYRGNEVVGRIMGIIYHPWNKSKNEKTARFYQLDCVNDESVAQQLLKKIESWAVSHNMSDIIGSFGFSDKDPQGIQVEGFEYAPVIASVSHQPYLSKLVESAGYVKFKDCVSYRMQIPEKMPEFYSNIFHRILKNNQLHLLNFHSRKELKPFFIPVMLLMNDAYKKIYGFAEMDAFDIQHLADQYLSVLDPELVKIVVNESKNPVAFVIAMANISKGLKKARGRLFPFGFLHILRNMRNSKQLDLLLGAVSESYRGRGLNVLMGISLMEVARKKGLTTMDSHLILEENRLMRAELEKLGGVLSKRYRIYQKRLITGSNL